jgi:hypothetical protein
MALQIAFKALNDTTRLDGLVPTLLVFSVYPRIAKSDPPAPTVIQRAAAIKRAIAEIRKIRAKRQVTEALRTRNRPRTNNIYDLPLNSEVLV